MLHMHQLQADGCSTAGLGSHHSPSMHSSYNQAQLCPRQAVCCGADGCVTHCRGLRAAAANSMPSVRPSDISMRARRSSGLYMLSKLSRMSVRYRPGTSSSRQGRPAPVAHQGQQMQPLYTLIATAACQATEVQLACKGQPVLGHLSGQHPLLQCLAGLQRRCD